MSSRVKKRLGGLVWLLAMALSLGTLVSQLTAEPGKGLLTGSGDQSGDVLTIDPTTGIAVPRSSLGRPAPAVAIDSLFASRDGTTDDTLLGTRTNRSALFEINEVIGFPALVGRLRQGSYGGLDFLNRDASSDDGSFPATAADGGPLPGTLFASLDLATDASSGADHLAVVDRSTGTETILGAFGNCSGIEYPFGDGGQCDLEGLNGLTFDAQGTLWAALGGDDAVGAPGLYTVDPVSGRASFQVSLFNTAGGPPGPPVGGIESLQFGCDGTLYGGTGAAGTAGGRLLQIDAATGGFSYVSRTPTVAGEGLGGLSFDDPCLTLLAPRPGTAGGVNNLRLFGATAGGRLRLYTAEATGTTSITVGGCGTLQLGLANARLRDAGTASPNGEGAFAVSVPPSFAGRTFRFQAVDRQTCTVSNIGTFTF